MNPKFLTFLRVFVRSLLGLLLASWPSQQLPEGHDSTKGVSQVNDRNQRHQQEGLATWLRLRGLELQTKPDIRRRKDRCEAKQKDCGDSEVS